MNNLLCNCFGVVVTPWKLVGYVGVTLACTFDHRWIDGHTAVQFIVRVKDLLEKPENLWFVA